MNGLVQREDRILSVQNMLVACRWETFEQLLIFNALTDNFRYYFHCALSLTISRSQAVRVIVNEPETKKQLLSFLEDNRFKISNEAERKDDELIHWNIMQKMRSSRQEKEDKLKFLLCEVTSSYYYVLTRTDIFGSHETRVVRFEQQRIAEAISIPRGHRTQANISQGRGCRNRKNKEKGQAQVLGQEKTQETETKEDSCRMEAVGDPGN